MAIRYAGIGGSNANNGSSWALRKLTITAVAALAVAGDTLYIGPGTYREEVSLVTDGTAGNIITYIADVTGQNTDGIGGVVRVTGSDNDTTVTRTSCMYDGRNYTTLRGFTFDSGSTATLYLYGDPNNFIIEDCIFNTNTNTAIAFEGTITNCIVRRCVFSAIKGTCVSYYKATDTSASANSVENCIFLAINGRGVSTYNIGGITVKNCLFFGGTAPGVEVGDALASGQTVTVNNCIFTGLTTGVSGTVSGEIVENYNSFFANGTHRVLTATGANSDVFPFPLNLGVLLAGINLANFPFIPENWANGRAVAGTGEPANDFFNMVRPTVSAKKSRGPVQFNSSLRDVATVRTGAASIKLPDACRHQMFVPVTNVSTTISCYVRREANYAGTAPQMIIKQPGQSDITVTDAGAVSTWNQLTNTFTPAALPPYVVIEFVSNNTAVSSSFATYFDDLTVT